MSSPPPSPPMHDMRCRHYRPSDRNAVMAIFDSNVPDAFQPSEREAFAQFLANPNSFFLVLEDHAGTVIGCGGFSREGQDNSLNLCWGAVGKRWQRRGAGRFLMRARLSLAASMSDIENVTMSAPAHTAPVWEQDGFETLRVEENGIMPGIHKAEMRLVFTPELRRKVQRMLEESLEAGHQVERGLIV